MSISTYIKMGTFDLAMSCVYSSNTSLPKTNLHTFTKSFSPVPTFSQEQNSTMTDNANHADGTSPFDASAENHSTVPVFLDGKQVVLSSTFDIISPLNNKFIWKASAATVEDANAAVESSQKAFASWSTSKINTRRDIFLRAAEIMRKAKDESYHYSYSETGESMTMFDFEFETAVEILISIAGLLQVATINSQPVVTGDNSSALVIKEPYGVVLAIASWNAPHALSTRSFLLPIAMGNTVVFKGSEIAPKTAWALARYLHEAGLPAGVLNTLYHRREDATEVTGALIAHPAIRKVNFTGSTFVGGIIASLAGKHLKPTVMELGGKAPAIVCEDADLDLAASQCVQGAFQNAGQICMSTERILVHTKVIEPFRMALKPKFAQMFGDGAEHHGLQLVASAAVTKNKKMIADALSKGATVVLGDANHDADIDTRMRPVAVEGVKAGMDLYHSESFGPTVSLIEVQDDEEAIKIANDTEYGLSSAVFTKDLARGLRLGRQLQFGAVHINSMTIHDEPTLPHGGVKNSGWGRFNGLEGLQEWYRLKTITWKD